MENELFTELVANIKEGRQISGGEKPPTRPFRYNPLDIKRIRGKYKLTQEKFADMLGISVRTLRNWEQGRRIPEGPAMILLRVADRDPQAVLDALNADV